MNTPKAPFPLPASDLFAVLLPVLDWYQSDEADARPPLDIIRDIVADLQTDRHAALVASSAYRAALELCHQIERCGCSEELTKASIMASDLRAKLASANAPALAHSGGEKTPTNKDQLDNDTAPRSADQQQACSAVFAAVYALRLAVTSDEKVDALRSVFIRGEMFISVQAEEELDALEFYIAETMLLPNDPAMPTASASLPPTR